MNLKNISLNLYSFGYYAGFVKDPNRVQKVLGVDELVQLAKQYGLGGVEFPFDHFYDIGHIEQGIDKIKEIQKEGLSVFIDLEKTSTEYISQLLPHLSAVDIRVVRIKMDQIGQTIYGGNRYSSETFSEAIEQFKQQLIDLAPALEEFGITLAIENHQDFHSTELVEISNNISPERIGVTWDVGNSISMVDSPNSFYSKTKNIIRNVHLKDYMVHSSLAGVELVRCPLGDGYVDYKSVLEKLSKNQNIVNMSIELGAQNPRECRIKNNAYWLGLSEIPVDKDSYLDFVNQHVTPESHTTPRSRHLTEEDLIKGELQDLERSVQNLKRMLGELNG